MRKFVAAWVFSALALALPPTAKAATILDFNSGLYSAANGASSFSTIDQGVEVNVQSSLFLSTLNHLPQGIGLNFPFLLDDTELAAGETLTVNFNSAQFLESFSLRLLFGNLGGGGQGEGAAEAEGEDEGAYSINGGAFVPFVANSDGADLTLVIGQPDVTQIQFQAPGFVDDYALGDITVTAVPEPASLILLGTGLLFAARRRHQMKRQQ
jgi:hypothetical protein